MNSPNLFDSNLSDNQLNEMWEGIKHFGEKDHERIKLKLQDGNYELVTEKKPGFLGRILEHLYKPKLSRQSIVAQAVCEFFETYQNRLHITPKEFYNFNLIFRSLPDTDDTQNEWTQIKNTLDPSINKRMQDLLENTQKQADSLIEEKENLIKTGKQEKENYIQQGQKIREALIKEALHQKQPETKYHDVIKKLQSTLPKNISFNCSDGEVKADIKSLKELYPNSFFTSKDSDKWKTDPVIHLTEHYPSSTLQALLDVSYGLKDYNELEVENLFLLFDLSDMLSLKEVNQECKKACERLFINNPTYVLEAFLSVPNGNSALANWLASDCFLFLEHSSISKENATHFAEALKERQQAHPFFQVVLGYCYEYGIGVEENGSTAFKLYEGPAKQGYALAQNNLGFCYGDGIGTQKDLEMAVQLYKQAADQGFVPAKNNLANCFFHGRGVQKDAEKAFHLFKQTADQGNTTGLNNLAIFYWQGIFVKEDHKQAFKFLQQASEKGNLQGTYNLGFCYLTGIGVKKDEIMATQLFQVAADGGNADALNDLGYCYMYGVGVLKDLRRAFKDFQEAADRGSVHALINLSHFYLDGRIVPKDQKKGIALLQAAADKGNIEAQKQLESLKKISV